MHFDLVDHNPQAAKFAESNTCSHPGKRTQNSKISFPRYRNDDMIQKAVIKFLLLMQGCDACST